MMTHSIGLKVSITAVGLVGILALSACTGATSEQQQQAAAAKPLSGGDLQTTLVGNTLTGKSRKGPSYAEFYDPSGQIRGLWNGKDKYDGKWSIKGDTFCTDYDGTDDDGCTPMSVNGAQVFWISDDGSVANANRPATLASGNPNGL